MLGSLYIGWGAWQLSFAQDWRSGVDLGQRKRELQYVQKAQNPMDVAILRNAKKAGQPVPDLDGRNAKLDKKIGYPSNGGYPPWAYFFAGPVMMISDPDLLKRSWAVLCVCSIAFCGWRGWQELRPFGRSPALLCAGSVLAIGGTKTSIYFGQWSTPLLAVAFAALWLLKDRRKLNQTIGGLLMAVAVTKVTLTLPLMTPLLLTRRWLALTAAGVLLAIATTMVCVQVSTPPWTMLSQMTSAGSTYAHRGFDAAGLLIASGVPAKSAVKGAALAVAALAAAVHWFGRDRSLLWHFGVAGLVGRLWTYHKEYDNAILALLLVALLYAAVRSGKTHLWVGFWLLGLSLWVPPIDQDNTTLQIVQSIPWLIAGGLFIFGTSGDEGDRCDPESAAVKIKPATVSPE